MICKLNQARNLSSSEVFTYRLSCNEEQDRTIQAKSLLICPHTLAVGLLGENPLIGIGP